MPLCEYVIQTLRYNGRDRRRHREVRDIGTVMSTPVESDKRDRERVGLHNESSSMEVACGRDGEKERGRDRLKYSNGE